MVGSLSAAERVLLTLPRFADAGSAAIKPGLERIRALLDEMGQPHTRYPAVLIGGTNGKGSVASMLAAICTAAGSRTGLHTSPHLLTVHERMRVDGQPTSETWLDEAVAEALPLFERVGPSFFEATVALSLSYFADRNVDLAVVEVGLGGRLDATNVLDPMASVVTRIALDHEDILGPGLESIAREKAHIARPGRPLVTSVGPGPALDVIRDVAGGIGASVEAIRETVSLDITAATPSSITLDIETPSSSYADVEVDLGGRHQAWNAALALRAAEIVLHSPTTDREGAIRTALANVRWLAGLRGRCEILAREPWLVVDVAHNPDGLSAALEVLATSATGDLQILLGLMRDKDVCAVAGVIAPSGARVLTVDLPSERAFAAADLAALLCLEGVNAVAVEGVQAAVGGFFERAGPSDGLLATGSHLLVEQVLRHGAATAR